MNVPQFMYFMLRDSWFVSVFSMLSDKDVDSVVKLLKNTVLKWKIAPLTVPRAASLEQLQTALQHETVEQFDCVQAAFQSALAETNNNQLILVCGSFHTLEAVWEYLDECQ